MYGLLVIRARNLTVVVGGSGKAVPSMAQTAYQGPLDVTGSGKALTKVCEGSWVRDPPMPL